MARRHVARPRRKYWDCPMMSNSKSKNLGEIKIALPEIQKLLLISARGMSFGEEEEEY